MCRKCSYSAMLEIWKKWNTSHKSNRLYTFLRCLAYIKNWYKQEKKSDAIPCWLWTRFGCNILPHRRRCCCCCCHFRREYHVRDWKRKFNALMMWSIPSHLSLNMFKSFLSAQHFTEFFSFECVLSIFKFTLHTVIHLIHIPSISLLLCAFLSTFWFVR